MKLLLDTHVVFWSLADDPRLPENFRRLMEDAANTSCVSVVTGWEISTKVRIGKWPEASVLLPGLTATIRHAGFLIEPLTLDQAERAGSIEAGHKDPFDRLLAAQALDQGLVLLTVDRVFINLGCQVG